MLIKMVLKPGLEIQNANKNGKKSRLEIQNANKNGINEKNGKTEC